MLNREGVFVAALFANMYRNNLMTQKNPPQAIEALARVDRRGSCLALALAS
jgi:hypothetical protein